MVYLFLFLTLVTSTLCQMDGMKPDVRFNAENDRFDVANIVQMQNNMYHQQMAEVEDEDDGGDGETERRNNKRKHNRHHKHRKIPDASLTGDTRRNLLLDNYRAEDDAEIDGYSVTLPKSFGRRFFNRRSGNEAQQLLNYAVPIHVKIQGYLQAP